MTTDLNTILISMWMKEDILNNKQQRIIQTCIMMHMKLQTTPANNNTNLKTHNMTSNQFSGQVAINNKL